MTSRERFQRMFEHREADRIPIIDSPWDTTIDRWHREGMPEDVHYVDYFGLDRVENIRVDNSPRYEAKIIEQTDEFVISTTAWGVTLKKWRRADSTPEFLDFTIVDHDRWESAKARMLPTRDRIDWDLLKTHYREWRKQGAWIQGRPWFGFDVTHSWTVGTERLLMAIVADPEWCIDMFNHFLEVSLALLDMVWNEGYEFDSILWQDDVGFKNSQFFSVDTYRLLLKPVQERAADWAHAKGVKVHLHSCGDVNPFVPEFIDLGIDALNPLEVKAGMDPLRLKRRFGGNLVLHGGINAVLWDDVDAITAEMERVVPVLKESGGYIFSSDHSVPSSVNLESFRRITHLAKELGVYE